MKKEMTLEDLKAYKGEWKKAVVVFTEDTFCDYFSEKERSYEIYATAYYFDHTKISKSLFGNCLDGTEKGVRLDHYLWDGWKVETCYIVE